MIPVHFEIEQLLAKHVEAFRQLISVFETAFEERFEQSASEFYLTELLSKPDFLALVVRHNNQVIAGLTGYELMKYKREETEFFLYDLAVAESYRRQGLATRLLLHLQEVLQQRGVNTIFVDTSAEDVHALALYESLKGQSEQVVQFTWHI